MLARAKGWEKLLAAAILSAEKKAFAWGSFDCALFACDCVLAITGTDPAANLRGKYSTEAEARTIIGGDLASFAAAMATQLGMQAVTYTYARRGDVVLVNNSVDLSKPSFALGIVDLSGRFVLCAGEKHLIRVPMHRWVRAWRVG